MIMKRFRVTDYANHSQVILSLKAEPYILFFYEVPHSDRLECKELVE